MSDGYFADEHLHDNGELPLAWRHSNHYGRYRFESALRPVSLAAIADQLIAGTVSVGRCRA